MSTSSFVLLITVFQLSVISDLKKITLSYRVEQKTNLIDIFYDELKKSGADSILLYHELRESETKGLISWKKADTLYGIMFKIISGKMQESKINNTQKFKLKEVRSLYFENENTIVDTLPPFPWQSTNVFEVNIRSFHTMKERSYVFSCDQIYFGTFTISKVGNKCSDILFGF